MAPAGRGLRAPESGLCGPDGSPSEGAEAPAFWAALEAPAALALRVNPARPAAGELRPLFARDPVPWAENGYYLLPGARPGAGLSHFLRGFLPCRRPPPCSPPPFWTCARASGCWICAPPPGGKSSQLAAALGGEGLLHLQRTRAQTGEGAGGQSGAAGGLPTPSSSTNIPKNWPGSGQGFFDAVLVDAPCSGEGMFRREPDSRSQWQPNSPAGCAKRQAGILDRAAELLRPGGRLVYSTCTYNTAENEETVAAFLARHPEFSSGDFSRARPFLHRPRPVEDLSPPGAGRRPVCRPAVKGPRPRPRPPAPCAGKGRPCPLEGIHRPVRLSRSGGSPDVGRILSPSCRKIRRIFPACGWCSRG